MAIDISHYPQRSFNLIGGITPTFTVDLNQSVKEKLKEGEKLTNETALKIFKQIKWKSDVLSFLTKPVVLLPLAAILFGVSFSMPVATGLALKIASLVFSVLTGLFLGYILWNFLNGILPQLSQAYKQQSERANEHIRALKAANHELEFNLACNSWDKR